MDSSGEGEDFQDIWTEIVRDRRYDQRGPKVFTELPRLWEIAERHGVCGKDEEERRWQVRRIQTRDTEDAGDRG